MRFVDLEKFKKVRQQVVLRSGLFFSIPLGLLLFFLTVSGGFFSALLTGVIVFVLMFAIIFGLRLIMDRGVERKREKTDFECLYIDVMFRGEMGALSILDDRLKYHSLTPGSDEKDFEIELNKNTFVAAGPIKYSKLQSIRYKGIQQGYVIARELPHGIGRKFIFYDIDGALEKVSHRIEEVSKFEGEKQDGETKKED